MKLTINGRVQNVDLSPPLTLARLLDTLGMKPDRIAVELNGEIVPRDRWATAEVIGESKLEVVHFVGGGANTLCSTCD